MDPLVWTFVRGDEGAERLTIARDLEVRRPRVRLIVNAQDAARSFDFADITEAVRFQSDMESFLLKTGWSFMAFAPERRTGADRRGFPRCDERRRWWTDGTITVRQFLDRYAGELEEPGRRHATRPTRNGERDRG